MEAALSYGDPVARQSDEIDREAWARLLKEMLAAAGLTPEQASVQNKGPVSVPWRTLYRWLNKEHGVSAARVRDVCRELGYPVIDALVRVGFLSPKEAQLRRQLTAVPPLPQPLRAIADVLTDKRIPESAKATLNRGVQAAFDLWMDMHRLRAPRERPARERGVPPPARPAG